MAALTPPPSIKYLNADTQHTHTDGSYKSDARKTFMMLKGKIYHNLIIYR